MDNSKIKRIGIAWYSENEWYKLCSVASDADRLEKNYAGWLRAFEKGYAELVRAGFIPVKVPVSVDELTHWCSRMGLAVNSEARSRFIAQQASRHDADRERTGKPASRKESVRQTLIKTIEIQIREQNPEETGLTLERLIHEGLSRDEAMKLIATVLVKEMEESLKTSKPFNRARYIKTLKALPGVPG